MLKLKNQKNFPKSKNQSKRKRIEFQEKIQIFESEKPKIQKIRKLKKQKKQKIRLKKI
jgi:hypothetical protein